MHQACYGISRVPKGRWYCRPCRTTSKNIVRNVNVILKSNLVVSTNAKFLLLVYFWPYV